MACGFGAEGEAILGGWRGLGSGSARYPDVLQRILKI